MGIISAKLKTGLALNNAELATEGLAGLLAKSASVAGLGALNIQLDADCRKAKHTDPLSFIQSLPEEKLVFSLNCDVEGQEGLLSADMHLINAIGDTLTGTLEATQGDVRRRDPTPIDAALTRPFFNEVMAKFSEILSEFRSGKTTNAYQTGDIQVDPSPHQFPDISHLKLAVTLDFEKGARSGQMHIMLPVNNTEFVSTVRNIAEDSAIWKQSFVNAINEAPSVLEVILHRKHMPISKIMRLKVGDLIEVPSDALESLTLETLGANENKRIMEARLGELQEMRAAKITKIGTKKGTHNNGSLLIPKLEL